MPVLRDQPYYFCTKLSEPSGMFLETGAFFLYIYICIPEAILRICGTAKYGHALLSVSDRIGLSL